MLPAIKHRNLPGRRQAPLAVVGVALASAAICLPTGAALAQQRAPAAGESSVTRPFANAPSTFADLVQQVKPSVVSIKVTSGGNADASRSKRWRRGPRSGGGSAPFPDLPPDHPLNELFKNLPREFQGTPRGSRPNMLRRSQGSGFVISADGYVVTNNHVVKGGGEITVSFDDKENLPAEVIGTDARTDLALLKIKSDRTFKFVKFAEKPSRVGDWVMAVGNPFGLGGTVTVGVLSASGRAIGSGPYDFLQIDAAVNRGNSGGPTFNLNGEVIGVNTAIYSPSGGNVGIAFAVPSTTAKDVIEQLKASGKVQRGWLGVKIQTITDDIAASLGLSGTHGALINEVTEDGPAKSAGLRDGDAILTVDGERIEDSRDLARKIAAYKPGEKVDVGISRGGSSKTVNVELGTFPTEARQAASRSTEPRRYGTPRVTALKTLGLDLVLEKLTPNDDSESVIIRDVNPESDAARKGVREGDVITAVNGEKVSTPTDVDRLVEKAREKNRSAVLMTIKRGTTQTFVALQFKKSN